MYFKSVALIAIFEHCVSVLLCMRKMTILFAKVKGKHKEIVRTAPSTLYQMYGDIYYLKKLWATRVNFRQYQKHIRMNGIVSLICI